ncbi:hypothetical protein QFC19_006690 [Naganishia cerealis]|uniref:Uncharacterized protein n=1 Tax=Naganishia cerealis TaxID=610337 RepID=A0ACC2VES7_9TREE|nr:hypothetical protein QFC19_006690 [Naganishia cerealis]
MASISVGTRNLKFMQRGTQLPAAPATPGRSSAPAQPSEAGGRSKAGPVPQQQEVQEQQEEEEEWLDTSIVDSREEMKHLKAQETSSTRFQVFADSPGATKGRAGNGNVNGGKGKAELGSEGGDREPRDSSRRARKTRVKEEDDPSTPTATAQRFLKPSLGDDRRQGGSPLGSKTMKKGKTVDGTPLSSSTSRRKKRKSGEREDEGDEQVLMAGARGKRGKTASTKKKSTAAAMTADKDPDMEDLAGRAAAGGDADVERYLRSVIHEMED